MSNQSLPVILRKNLLFFFFLLELFDSSYTHEIKIQAID